MSSTQKIIKLNPTYKQYLWGGDKIRELLKREVPFSPVAESWEISTHPDGESVIAEGKHKGETLRGLLGELPVLVKYIDAKERLSVQVHPDEEYARLHENDSGKNEAWRVLAAEKNAFVYLGFKERVSPEAVRRAVKSGTVENLLNKIPVKAGDSFYIPAGTVHAIGAGCFILEIQQTSNITYRLYDWGRGRELHVEKALDVLDFNPWSKAGADKFFNREGGNIHFILVWSGEGEAVCGGEVRKVKAGETYLALGKNLTVTGCESVIINI